MLLIWFVCILAAVFVWWWSLGEARGLHRVCRLWWIFRVCTQQCLGGFRALHDPRTKYVSRCASTRKVRLEMISHESFSLVVTLHRHLLFVVLLLWWIIVRMDLCAHAQLFNACGILYTKRVG